MEYEAEMDRSHKDCSLIVPLALSLALALSSGCREKESPAELWDVRAAELRAELEREKSEVARVCDGYELDAFGDECRVRDRWRFVLRAYRKISDEFVKVRGREGVVLRNRWAHWLANRIEETDRLYGLERDRGSYGLVFHLDNKADFYERVIKLLLLDSEGLSRWMRIKGAQGTIAGVPIAFTNGDARVVLPWRVFAQKPYMNDVAYAPYAEPDHVVTLQGKDYVVVRFPKEDNLEGCPATTEEVMPFEVVEEAMLFEVVDGKIARVVGLHNFFMGGIRADVGSGLLHLEGVDGFEKSVSFVIDVTSMKIVRARSILPAYFEQDGYWQFLDVGIDTIGSPYEAEPKNAKRLYECGDLALFAGETDSDIAFNEKADFCNLRNSLFLRRRTKEGTDVWRLVMTSGGDWNEAHDMDRWSKDRMRDVKMDFNVLKASLSRDGRFIWLVCDPDTGTYDVVGRFDWIRNSFAVLIDGDTAEEQEDGTILVGNKKTYLSDENGEPLGAAWYDAWLTPDGKVVRKTKPTRKAIGE